MIAYETLTYEGTGRFFKGNGSQLPFLMTHGDGGVRQHKLK